MGAVIFGIGCGIFYLVFHGSLDMARGEEVALPPVRRSLRKVPASVSTQDQATQLRIARALISDLVNGLSLWVESRAEADQWLADYDKSDVDQAKLLQRTYLLLLGVEFGHKAMPALSREHERRVSSWLTEYSGKEERA